MIGLLMHDTDPGLAALIYRTSSVAAIKLLLLPNASSPAPAPCQFSAATSLKSEKLGRLGGTLALFWCVFVSMAAETGLG